MCMHGLGLLKHHDALKVGSVADNSLSRFPHSTPSRLPPLGLRGWEWPGRYCGKRTKFEMGPGDSELTEMHVVSWVPNFKPKFCAVAKVGAMERFKSEHHEPIPGCNSSSTTNSPSTQITVQGKSSNGIRPRHGLATTVRTGGRRKFI